MDIAAEKARLKDEIDKVTDPSVLLQIRNLLEHTEDTILTSEQIKMVQEEHAKYMNDPSTLESWDDYKAKIRKENGI